MRDARLLTSFDFQPTLLRPSIPLCITYRTPKFIPFFCGNHTLRRSRLLLIHSIYLASRWIPITQTTSVTRPHLNRP
jgi:hypothetical protein